MRSVDDAARIAVTLPEVTEGTSRGSRAWLVCGKTFAWERHFTKADIKRFGDVTPPAGPILAVRVDDLGEKEAVLSANPGVLFTIEHLDGYPIVLVHLARVTEKILQETIVDGWLAGAPARLTDRFVRDPR